MDSLTLIAIASIITSGLTIAIGSIGPALGEGRRRTVERLDDLADPIEIGRWWGQVEQQDQADDLGRRQAEADQGQELAEQRCRRPPRPGRRHVRFTLAVNM